MRTKPRESHLVYAYPLPLDPPRAHLDWQDIGLRIAARNPPIPSNQLHVNGPFLTCDSPESHTGAYDEAIDFLVPDDTEVLAAQNGIITAMVTGYYGWGPTKASAIMLNYITIVHRQGTIVEYSQYCHLAPTNVFDNGLKIGDYVRRGGIIGKVQKTGWTDRDHLHFMVFQGAPSSDGFISLPVRFEEVEEFRMSI